MGLQTLNSVGVGLFTAITDVIWLTSCPAFTAAVYDDDENEWVLELTQALFYGTALGLIAWGGYHAYAKWAKSSPSCSAATSFLLFNQVFTGIWGWILGYLITENTLDSENDHEIALGIGLGAAIASCLGQAMQERVCEKKISSNGTQWTVAAIGAFISAAAWYYIAELEIESIPNEANWATQIGLLCLSSGSTGWGQVELASRCGGKSTGA